mgnify:CR=1 FL=1
MGKGLNVSGFRRASTLIHVYGEGKGVSTWQTLHADTAHAMPVVSLSRSVMS